MQYRDHDDMDVFILLGKTDRNGKVLRHINYPPSKIPCEDLLMINVVQYQGATRMLQASHWKWEAKHLSYHEALPLTTESKASSDDAPKV